MAITSLVVRSIQLLIASSAMCLAQATSKVTAAVVGNSAGNIVTVFSQALPRRPSALQALEQAPEALRHRRKLAAKVRKPQFALTAASRGFPGTCCGGLREKF